MLRRRWQGRWEGWGAVVLGVVAAVGGGCAVNPVSGRHEVTLVSEARERELGEAEAGRVVETMGLLDDAGLVEYVRAVGARLARVSPRKDVSYTFNVVDLQEPNAFALPGGYVYVCGSRPMRDAVWEAFVDVVAEHGQMSRTRAEELVTELETTEKRYRPDVWG